MQTVQMAQECGVQIPEGLADGIASGEITPQQAIDQLNGTIEGTIQGVAEIANKAGIQIPEEIQAGINAGGTQAVSAMQELLALIQQQAADAQSADVYKRQMIRQSEYIKIKAIDQNEKEYCTRIGTAEIKKVLLALIKAVRKEMIEYERNTENLVNLSLIHIFQIFSRWKY